MWLLEGPQVATLNIVEEIVVRTSTLHTNHIFIRAIVGIDIHILCRHGGQASQMMEGDVIDGTGLEIIGCWALFGRFAQRPREEAIGWNSSSFDENAVLR